MAWSQSSLFINVATVSNYSSREDFFSGLVNLLDICKNYSFDVNLDFPSAAILFNQLDITVSVLRIVSDGVANVSLPCTVQRVLGCTWMQIPYLPVYNACPCIMRTPILDCTLEKKKKRKQKTEEVVMKELRKKIWKHSKNDNLIISSEMSLDAPATKRAVLPMDSFSSQPL